MLIAIIVGTRPEIIKMSPVIRHCINKKIGFFVIHSGQHYSFNMDQVFFEELELPQPKYNLGIKSTAPFRQGEHTGRMMIDIEKILLKEQPDIVLVHGDTNTTLAGALTTSKISTTKEYTGRHIKLGHVEAGLRSFDRNMPEEINRVIADHLSDYLFAPTGQSKENLVKEGIDPKKIFVTGNTIFDAVLENLRIADKKFSMLDKLSLKKNGYFLATIHRQESVDVKERLKNILKGLELVYNYSKIPIIYPIHPRTKKLIENFNLDIPKCIKIIEPLGFLEFLQLEANARLILTDSGGIQEESCILKVPCVTLRKTTERPETIKAGSNIIAGYEPESILASAKEMLKSERNWANPFGDGKAAEKIMKILA